MKLDFEGQCCTEGLVTTQELVGFGEKTLIPICKVFGSYLFLFWFFISLFEASVDMLWVPMLPSKVHLFSHLVYGAGAIFQGIVSTWAGKWLCDGCCGQGLNMQLIRTCFIITDSGSKWSCFFLASASSHWQSQLLGASRECWCVSGSVCNLRF